MLLDRKRINKWAKWVALFLAVVFAAGFLFMGVGYGGAGFNLSSLFTGNKTASSNPQTPTRRSPPIKPPWPRIRTTSPLFSAWRRSTRRTTI